MSGLTIQQEQFGETLILRLDGVFDVRTAAELAGVLAEAPPTRLLLDFSGVRFFSDAAVAVATTALAPHAVRFLGLDRHRERVFQYFGVRADPARRAPRGDVEESLLAG